MPLKRALIIGLPIAIVLICDTARAQKPADRFGLLNKLIDVTDIPKKLTLTDAIRSGAAAMRRDFMTVGVELSDRDYPVQPEVLSSIRAGQTVGDYLDDIFRQVGTYEYETVSSHAVSVFPKGAKDDPGSVLNLRVPQFDVEETHAGTILGFPALFIPELRNRLAASKGGQSRVFVFSGPVPPGPKVTVHLRNATLRDILNAVMVATERPKGRGSDDAPYGWIYRSSDRAGEKKPYFGVLWTMPPNWRDLVYGLGNEIR